MTLLGRDELLRALGELDRELGVLNVRAEVFIVGGAAMAIAYDIRRSTADVDAVFVPSAEVRVAASRVAERLNLEPDWLNDGAKAFMPGEDENRIGSLRRATSQRCGSFTRVPIGHETHGVASGARSRRHSSFVHTL